MKNNDTRKCVIYCRVSTTMQGSDGLGIDAQKSAAYLYVERNGLEIVGEHIEVESGRRNDRQELKAALASCRQNKAVLVIARLDRLARSVAFIANLLESNVTFIACNMPEADRTFLQMAAVFAEWEARQISERTKLALAEAKRRGVRLGGKRNDLQYVEASRVRTEKADAFAATIAPHVAVLRSDGTTSLRELANGLNARNISTRRGGQWTANGIKRLLVRL